MKIKNTILLLIAIAAITCSCEKYTLNKIYGQYILSKYTIDGIDSLQQMKARFGLGFLFYHEEYDDHDVLNLNDVGISSPFISTFYLEDHNKSIMVKTGSLMLTGYGASDFYDINFSIIKLKSNDIHLKTIYNNKEYYLELNQ